MDLAQLVLTLGGFARRSTLLEAGSTPRQLAAAVHGGMLCRPRRGLYVHPRVSTSQRHAAAHGGALTCAAALAEYGVWILDSPTTCVVIRDQGHALKHVTCDDAPVLHRRREAPSFGCDAPLQALRHFLLCTRDELAHACAIESCLAQGLVSSRELAALARALPRRLHDILAWCRPTAGSGLETIVRRELSLRGIEAQSQVALPGVGKVDLLIGDRLIIELDGRAYHSRERDFHRDRERDAQIAFLGGCTLRFDSSQVLHDLDAVMRTIVAVMARGEHRSRSLVLAHDSTRRGEPPTRRVPCA